MREHRYTVIHWGEKMFEQNAAFIEDDWSVDFLEQTLRHVTGMIIIVEGEMTHPYGVTPAKIPSQLTPLDQARLLRHAMQVLESKTSQCLAKTA